MNANKQDVGGLPELPEPAKRPFYFCNKCGHMGEVGPSHVRTDGTACDYHAATQGSFYTEEQMRAYGELCRAAPAGGDEDSLFTPAEHLAACREDWQRVCDALGADGKHMDPPDVLKAIGELRAPTGSGEVEETLRTLLSERNHRTDGTLQELADRCLHLSRGDRDLISMLRKLQQGADYVMVQKADAVRLAEFGQSHASCSCPTSYVKLSARRVLACVAASQGQEGGK